MESILVESSVTASFRFIEEDSRCGSTGAGKPVSAAEQMRDYLTRQVISDTINADIEPCREPVITGKTRLLKGTDPVKG